MSNKREQERERLRAHRLEREQAETQANARRRRLVQLGSGAVFLAVVVVAVLIVVSGNQNSGGSGEVVDVGLVDKMVGGIPQSGTTLGNPKAKVTVYEYGDLQCPVCKAYSEQVLPQIIEGQIREGKAKIEFRNFTIIGPQSKPAGAAALAAGKQGRGWNYIDIFYRNQGAEASGYATEAFLTTIAKAAGIKNLAQWNTDRKSKALTDKVSATTAEAENLGFTGTPSFAVTGPKSHGLNTLGTPGSAEAIEAAIKKAS
ncbi:MAG TPA: thioredoxin domain-containing protein [Solirubrobacterales bacterium]|nr:thioredoxin domain-containing protein [Solirubrobacterales bacterium]